MARWTERLREIQQGTAKTDETPGAYPVSSVLAVDPAVDEAQIGSFVSSGGDALEKSSVAQRFATPADHGEHSECEFTAKTDETFAGVGDGTPPPSALRSSANDLVAIGELLTAGSMLKWPRLEIAPHLTIKAGEDAWTKFLRCPPPGTLEAALIVAKRRVEEVWPF